MYLSHGLPRIILTKRIRARSNHASSVIHAKGRARRRDRSNHGCPFIGVIGNGLRRLGWSVSQKRPRSLLALRRSWFALSAQFTSTSTGRSAVFSSSGVRLLVNDLRSVACGSEVLQPASARSESEMVVATAEVRSMKSFLEVVASCMNRVLVSISRNLMSTLTSPRLGTPLVVAVRHIASNLA